MFTFGNLWETRRYEYANAYRGGVEGFEHRINETAATTRQSAGTCGSWRRYGRGRHFVAAQPVASLRSR